MKNVSAINLKSYIYQIISIGLSAINVKLCLNLFDDTGYSSWVLILSLINICYAFDLGAGCSIRNALAKSVSESSTVVTQARMIVLYYNKILVLAFWLFIALLLVGLINIKIGWLNSFGFYQYSTVLVLIIIDFVSRAHHPIFAGIQKPHISNLALALNQFSLYLCLQFIFVPSKIRVADKLFLLSVTMICSSILINLAFLVKLNRVVPLIRDWSNPKSLSIFSRDAGIFNEESFLFFLMQITFTLLGQVTGYFVFAKFSPESLVDISIAEKVFAPLIIGATILMYPFWSAYTVMWHRGEFDRIRILIKRQELLSFVGILGLVVCCGFYDKIISIWLNREVKNYFIPCFIALKVFAIILNSVYSYFMNGIGAVKPQIAVYSLGLLASVILLFFGGLYGNIYICLSATPVVFLVSALIQRYCIFKEMLVRQ